MLYWSFAVLKKSVLINRSKEENQTNNFSVAHLSLFIARGLDKIIASWADLPFPGDWPSYHHYGSHFKGIILSLISIIAFLTMRLSERSLKMSRNYNTDDNLETLGYIKFQLLQNYSFLYICIKCTTPCQGQGSCFLVPGQDWTLDKTFPVIEMNHELQNVFPFYYSMPFS